ncbi:4-(cytidine 5'-diphospho)-2-C-methyl-D-erythritol kinase [Pseudorhodobacter sp. W20_MBD10_FR17]|uniref:4-(cytidine 5'-diphospho)-2-C-methyl-D-erythritol kinase n=1 Tax=Pseudorhodobacter sp. W20_MBD10_FR17 TaxID=3240266 RepID=UPI003F9C0918
MVTERACAKVNLTLHVKGQRDDGYHLLDSLVVFAGVYDEIRVEPADRLSLEIDGPYGAGLAGSDNLVLRAARLLAPDRMAAIRLTKNLPIASGIGGGSADAAATLRALAQLWGLGLPEMAAVTELGADVPVCLASRPVRMRGIGEVISPLPPLPALDIVLVNAGVAVQTPQVFKALVQKTNPPMADMLPNWPDAAAFCTWLAAQRNDLQAPAASIAPEITETLGLLRATGCLFAGMSGSGATCFGLYPPDKAERAAASIAQLRPDWWAAAGAVLPVS